MTGGDDDTKPRRLSALMIGAIGAGVAAIAGMFGAHDASVWRLPSVLEARVETALQTSGFGGLEVRMDGQRAILRGLVEDETGAESARRAALAAIGSGGPWAGGVTHVDVSQVTVGRIDRPYTFSVRRERGRVVLTGAAPTQETRANLLSTAAAAFPNAEAIDEMHVAGGAPSPRYGAIVRDMIRGLARLNGGEARLVDNQIVFIGDGGQEGVDALRATFGNPPAPYRARLDVTIDGLDLANPELQGLNLQSGDAETCAAAFDRLLERNVINFNTGSAVIDPSSRRLLNALASVALRCDRFTLEVSGHTDNVGGRDVNMDLSLRRAEAVVSYLMTQGVTRDRLAARGYGPDRPRVSNATPAGQAANRRIEVDVTG